MIRKLRKHFLKLFIAWVLLTTALAVYVVRSDFVADRAHNYLLNYLEKNLQSKVTMGRPQIEWLRGSWYIKDVSIRPNFGKEETAFVAAKSVRISFLPWWNVLRREIGIRTIQLEDPSVYIRIEGKKIANLPSLDFLKGPKGLFRFYLREVRISGGKMTVSYPERPMQISFNGIQMKVRPDLEKKQYGFILANSSADIKAKDFTQKILSMKGDFSLTPDNLTIIKSTFSLPEGKVSAEGLYLKFATAEWVAKLSSELKLDAVKKAVGGRWPVVSEKVKDLKGKVNLSALIKGDRVGFDVKGEVRAAEIELDGFRIQDTSAGFSSKGQWKLLKESPFDIELRSKVPVVLVDHYFEKAPRMKGMADIHIKGSVAGGPWSGAEKLKIDGNATSSSLEVAGVPTNKASIRFVADLEKASISDISAELFKGSLKGSMGVNFKEDKGFKGNVHLEKVSMNDFSRWVQTTKRRSPAVKTPLNVSGSAYGDIDFAGGLSPATVDLTSSLKVEGLAVSRGESLSTMVPVTTITAGVSYDGKVTRIRSLKMETPATTVSASGDVAEGVLSMVLDLKSSDLSEFGGYVKGGGTLKGKITGHLNDLSAEGSAALSKVSWGKYSVDHLSGYLAYKDRVFSSTGLRVIRGDSELSLRGEVSIKEAPRVDANFELKKGRLEDVVSFAGIDLQMKGEVYARGKARGGLRSLDGDIEINGKKLVISDEEIDNINIVGRLHRGRLLLDKGEVLRNGKSVTVTGEIGPDGDSNLRIATSPLFIAALPYVKKAGIPVDGTVEVVGEVTGNIKNPSIVGRVSVKDLIYRNISLGSGNLAVSMSDWRIMAAGSAFGSEINGKLALKNGKPFHIHVRTNDLPLAPYFKGIERLEGVSGSLSFTLDADGELSNLKSTVAKGYISKFQVARDPFFIKNTKDVEVELADGKILLRSFHLVGKGTEIDVSGWAGIEGESNLAINGTLDLYLLQMFMGVIDKGEGIAEVQLAISGKPPRMEGKITVKDGVIGFKGFEYLFSDISAALTLKGESLILESLAGRVAEGSIKGAGTVQMDGLSLKRTDISLDLSGLHLSFPRWLPSEVEGSLRLSGDYPFLLLSGDMNVIRARYSEKVDWRTFLPSFKRRLQEPAALREGAGALRVDINLKADRNLIFENNLGRAELKGEVRLKGDTSKLGIVGNMEVISGKVFYKEHEFKITSGIIEFPDPKKVEAVLDFTAEGKVRDNVEKKVYDIQILVQGNINDLKVTMTSTPVLSDLDIASLISLGVTSKGLQERGGEAPAYGAASLLTSEIEDKFKDYIGFERFHIDPYYSKRTSSTEPKLTVGKEISEDTFVIYSRGLSGTGEQEAQVEYKLFGNFSLIGGWSSFGASREGDLGADFKFRFEFR